MQEPIPSYIDACFTEPHPPLESIFFDSNSDSESENINRIKSLERREIYLSVKTFVDEHYITFQNFIKRMKINNYEYINLSWCNDKIKKVERIECSPPQYKCHKKTCYYCEKRMHNTNLCETPILLQKHIAQILAEHISDIYEVKTSCEPHITEYIVRIYNSEYKETIPNINNCLCYSDQYYPVKYMNDNEFYRYYKKSKKLGSEKKNKTCVIS